METSLPAALGLGFLLGIRHAMDADHVAAVSALVSQYRSLTRSCLLGAFWGAGHTAALLVAGVAVVAFKFSISAEMERGFEMLVALVLILLGGHVFLKSLGAWTLHRHAHSHDGHRHSHFHVHAGGEAPTGHLHLLQVARRPFLVGLLHGLAGSAALMLMVLSTIPSPLGGLLFIVVFGIGSTAAMLLLSGLIGIPFALAADRTHGIRAAVQALAGGLSLTLGIYLVWSA